MYDECKGQHGNCDICDGLRHDPNTGWGGFTDHHAKKHFYTDDEQTKYYKEERKKGRSGYRESWKDE